MIHQLDPFRQIQLRKKVPVWNISQLLDKQVVTPPQKAITQRLFSQNHRKNTIMPNLITKNQTNHNKLKETHNKINFQHSRIKSSLKNQNSSFSFKRSLTQDPNVNSLKIKQSQKIQLKTFQLHSSRSVQKAKFHQNYKSQQIISTKLIEKSHIKSRERVLNLQKYSKINFFPKSLDLKSKIQLFPQQSHDFSSHKINHRNNFLKKGTSLQKQIVINLLKNKIIKENHFDIQRQYEMSDIVNMIKVYKGYHKNQQKNPGQFASLQKNFQSSNFQKSFKQKQQLSCPLNVVELFKKSIQGWEMSTDFDMET